MINQKNNKNKTNKDIHQFFTATHTNNINKENKNKNATHK